LSERPDTPTCYSQSLLAAHEDTSTFTEKFIGKPASDKAGNPDFLAMWAGQAAPLSREMSAAQLVVTLEHETLEAIERFAALRGWAQWWKYGGADDGKKCGDVTICFY
jgi:hypothetical protein